jgi:cell fate (sporulation/competence/biofilm development) regulator YlbF (YheA/YmcA/DUF963 family)
MQDTLELSRQLNRCIRESDVYKNYQYCKEKLKQRPDKLKAFLEYKQKNYEIQHDEMLDNPYDEVNNLFQEYDTLVHDTIVNDFMRAERKLVYMMRNMYEEVAQDLDFDISEDE